MLQSLSYENQSIHPSVGPRRWWSEGRVRLGQMMDEQHWGKQGQGSQMSLRTYGHATFHEARTNRLGGRLFWSHSCKHDLWRCWTLAPRRFVHHAIAVPAIRSWASDALPILPLPPEQGVFSSSDPSWFFPRHWFSFLLSLIRESWRMCIIEFGIHWPQCSLSFYCKAASSWWNLALLISISDLLDTGSFIIQGKSGYETTVW